MRQHALLRVLILIVNVTPSLCWWGNSDPTDELVKTEQQGVNKVRLLHADYPHMSNKLATTLVEEHNGYDALGAVYDRHGRERKASGRPTNVEGLTPDLRKIDRQSDYNPLHLDKCRDHDKVVRWAKSKRPLSTADQRYDTHVEILRSTQSARQVRADSNALHKIQMTSNVDPEAINRNIKLRDEVFAKCKVNACKKAEHLRQSDPAYKDCSMAELLSAAERMQVKGKRTMGTFDEVSTSKRPKH